MWIAVILTVLSVFIVLPILWGVLNYFYKYKYMIDITANIPSPPTWPIVGHGHYFINQPPHKYLYIFLNEFYEKCGKTFKIWLGPELNIMFSDEKDVKVILTSKQFNDKSDQYMTLRNWLSDSLLLSSGQKWQKRRKAITPAFHFKILDSFIDIFEKGSRTLLKNLEAEYNRQSDKGLNLYEWVNLYTLDTVGETSMGVSLNAQADADSEYVQAVKTIISIINKRMFDLIYRYNITYQFTKLAREEKKALAVLHGFSEKIITQRREELLKTRNKTLTPESDSVETKRIMPLLDILLQMEIDGKPLTNLDIREEVDAFIFGGYDTSSSALNFCFYNLSLNPKCQEKCFEEILVVFGRDKSKPVTHEDLNNLHYMELCIKETLRLFPSAPMLGRKVTEECEINGQIVPAGANIGISPLQLGRTEELFPDHDKFKPERFEVNNTDKMSPFAFIPFSAGPRNCLGQRYAMLLIKTILSNILRHYELEYDGNKDEELLLIGEIILKPKDPLLFKLKPRLY